jgi:hypothetical protein
MPCTNKVAAWILWEHTPGWRITFSISIHITSKRWRNKTTSTNEAATWMLWEHIARWGINFRLSRHI